MENRNNWKNQLRNRKVTPSDEAWLAIEAGLEKKNSNQPKKKFIITLIAASFIGFVVFLSIPTQTRTIEKSNTVKVKTPIQSDQSVFPEALFLEVNSALTSADSEPNSETQTNATLTQSKLNTKKEPNSSLISVAENKKSETLKIPAKEEKIKASKAAIELLAEVEAELAQTIEINSTYSPDEEAEILLAEAKLMIQEVDYDRLYEFAQASDLLAEAENNLSEERLQGKVWLFVQSNVKHLETAFASLK